MQKNDINNFNNDLGFDFEAYAEILSRASDDVLLEEYKSTQAIIDSEAMNCVLIDIALNLDNILKDEIFKRWKALINKE